MEAIKCPNCGSEMVRQLTDEKYVCIACDAEFLVHNLSKEFRKTDKHITDVHVDLRENLDQIKAAIRGEVSEEEYLNSLLEEAEDNLSQGYIQAYDEFKEYAERVPDSYVGYYGMFRALTGDMEDDQGEIVTCEEEWKDLYDGFDVLKKALECRDCDKEKVLSEVLTYFKRSSNTAAKAVFSLNEWEKINRGDISRRLYTDEYLGWRYRGVDQFKNYLEQMVEGAGGFNSFLFQRIEQIKGNIEGQKVTIQQKREAVKKKNDERERERDIYSQLDQKGKLLWWLDHYKILIGVVLVFIVLALLTRSAALIAIDLIIIMGVAINAYMKFTSKAYVYDETSDARILMAMSEDLTGYESFLMRIDGINAITEEIMENIIMNSYDQGDPAEEMHRLIVEVIERREEEERQREEEEKRQEEIRKADEAAGLCYLTLVARGNKKQLYDILVRLGNGRKWAHDIVYKTSGEVIIYSNLRRSVALELQKEMASSGAIIKIGS